MNNYEIMQGAGLFFMQKSKFCRKTEKMDDLLCSWHCICSEERKIAFTHIFISKWNRTNTNEASTD